ncbi:DNA polymerase III subunit beta [Candidatus Kinetoplastibacterium sorsogonicusi]|uniref:Beta sliding clamp n=1 Tax=Candidatus Kinetoplastidibacterium kentomonadis TaxID=1576550 RepID=A0A3Q8F5Z9_9PROT|nr:DNA polymerase III subunit beta [Candidatus Kinetoplastibacterium sorsogonicusi]AWD32149.1 DNA polymerase III subunit beta [Candidatus Kinetoplastibacterium sorsogonicusi]
MQIVSVNRDYLLKAILKVTGVVDKRQSIPILSNILLLKENKNLSILATDLEIQVTVFTKFGYSDSNCYITLSARKLLEILKSLPCDNNVSLSLLSENRLSIISGKSKFSLQTLPYKDFPVINQLEQFDIFVKISQKNLFDLINTTYFAMAHQDVRFYLNGLLLVFDKNIIKAVATDGHRLAFNSMKIDYQGEYREVIIPRKNIIELIRLLNNMDDDINIDVGFNQIKFSFSDIEIISKLVDGKFPDFNKVIPNHHKRVFSIKRDVFHGSLMRVSIMTNDKFKGILINLKKNLMSISSNNANHEEALEEIDIEYEYENLNIGFNVNYLLDVINNIKSNTLIFSIGNDNNSSALIRFQDHENFKYVVMPMRI